MDEKSDQILDHIETQRNQLGANLNELETRVRRTTDWRTHFDNNPMLMLGAALGGGLLLGAIVTGARSSRSSSSYTSSKYYSSSSGTTTGANTATAVERHRASETIDHIKAALIAFATSKAKEFLNQALPGFDRYLHDSESKGSRTAGSESYSSTGYQGGYGEGSQPSTSYGQTGGSYGTGSYGQQTSGSGQGANYGQNFGTDYGMHGAGQRSYTSEREQYGAGSYTPERR